MQREVAWRLVVKGVFYGLTADKDLFALNPATGGELWRSSYEKPPLGKGSGRGLVYWEGRSADGQQIQRILLGIGHEMLAIDALSGERDRQFGDDGELRLPEAPRSRHYI